jgi:hypothetical protein
MIRTRTLLVGLSLDWGGDSSKVVGRANMQYLKALLGKHYEGTSYDKN